MGLFSTGFKPLISRTKVWGSLNYVFYIHYPDLNTGQVVVIFFLHHKDSIAHNLSLMTG
ncbi:hypothetical protein [Cecembia calidifontis]|uniref:hypothetical protein n=1 Tax=Cecembia calidifontis TaxID=1187080 RepID=UPI0013EE49DA|nr:hypothetical protein [Cecembia calidifontis]